jgi:hypothetical protein
MGETLPRRVQRKHGRMRVEVEIPDVRPALRAGDITIDTSGIGYREWLASIGDTERLNSPGEHGDPGDRAWDVFLLRQ